VGHCGPRSAEDLAPRRGSDGYCTEVCNVQLRQSKRRSCGAPCVSRCQSGTADTADTADAGSVTRYPPHMEDIGIVAEAASWAIGAKLAAALPEHYRLIESYPSHAQSNALRLLSRDHASSSGEVIINRMGPGAILVRSSDGADSWVGGAHLWARAGSGALGVTETSAKVLNHLGVTDGERAPAAQDRVYEAIALTLRHAALFGLDWRCLWGVDVTPSLSPEDQRARLFEPYRGDLDTVDLSDDRPDGARGDYWFLVDPHEHEQEIAMFDTNGYVVLPQGHGFADLTSPTEYPPPSDAVDRLFGPLIQKAVSTHKAATTVSALSGLGLPAKLSAFTRKERLFLFGFAGGGLDTAELHGPALRLDAAFRATLADVIGLDVPAHAWASVDFHLSWIHGALQWQSGAVRPGQIENLPLTSDGGESAWITGSQEDVDLVVAWAEDDVTHLVLIEAKAYGAWSNSQATSKMGRVAAIRAAAPVGVEIRFAICSPSRPQHLHTQSWPKWALASDGSPAWFRLPVPRLRLSTERCDDAGASSESGSRWHIRGPLP